MKSFTAAAREFLGTSLVLIGLYLVLAYAAGATGIISSLASGTAVIFKTLQARS